MSAEKPTHEQPPEGTDRQSKGSPIGQQDKPAAEKKPPAAKKAAPKKSAAEQSAAEKSADATKSPVAKKAAVKKTEAKKSADEKKSAGEKKPAADKEPVAKTQDEKKPPTAKAEESTGAKPEKPAAPKAEKPAAATRRDSGASASTSRRKVVRAQARYVRTSARKARMVCGHLRGKSVPEARAILAFTPREVARDWSKLLESAVANAENNHELIEDDLLVREAYADEGPTIKRFRPRAQGRATPIRKRTSHLTITLTPKP